MQAQLNRSNLLLRNTLYGNVAFTLISLLIFLFATQPLATFLGISYSWLLTVLGVGFIPFAGFVFWVANERPINGRFAKAVIGMDLSWVFLSYAFLLFAWSDLTVGGRWFVFLQAEAVFFFGLFQYLGLRKLQV